MTTTGTTRTTTTYTVKINLTTLIILAIIAFIVIGGAFKYHKDKVDNLNDELLVEVKLKDALLDSVSFYQNKHKEWVAQKLTIQETIRNLEKIKGQLTQSQKDLISRVKEVELKNSVIAAALIRSQIIIDSLLHKGTTIVDPENNTIVFTDHYKNGTKELNYKFTVGNALPSPANAIPTLMIDSLHLPNTQFIDFHWKNDKKKGYPITFSVTNSNGFFKTVDIDSYAITPISKIKLNPNGWEKISNFFIKNRNTMIYVGVGSLVGGLFFLYLTK